MVGAKRRKPRPTANRDTANRRTSTSILAELAGTLVTTAIFAGIVWTSAFGMAGGFDRNSDAGFMLAGVDPDER